MAFRQRIKPFVFLFLVVESSMRLLFLLKEWAHIDGAGKALQAIMVGFAFDLCVFAFFLIPLALYHLLLPAKYQGMRRDRIISSVLFGLFGYIMLFTSVSEWFFWDEFAARFNFIAVDYLVYTHEVIGNIRESYPLYPLLAGVAVVAIILGYAYSRRSTVTMQPVFRHRVLAFAACIALATTAFYTGRSSWGDIGANRFENEIARNGIFELFSAYRHNELDYAHFYRSSPDDKALLSRLRGEIDPEGKNFLDDGITHRVNVVEPERHYNIVLITVESLSADFLGSFGNKEGLTPYLDQLAGESLVFTNLYATGTRTVYGLCAITLSIPPLPGNSIVRRPQNEHLFSLGSVLNAKGYNSKFIYGGFGYFDNMNYFFENNGYGIVDRTSMAKDEITFANVWGVADEDLFRRTIRENDKAHAAGKPFFDMVMTTSNHRPFTYPDDKIDIPSHTGRRGGVKYTDYAIRQLIEESRSHPWFDNTIFVIVADHTAGGAGKSELDPEAYHIPMLVYAPRIIKPGKVETLASQIDVAPTILGLLNMDYDSRFYGRDVLRNPLERALISNYQQLGYLTKDRLVTMKPVKELRIFQRSGRDFILQPDPDPMPEQTALSYFQNATRWKEWNKQIYSNATLARAAHYEDTAH